MTRKNKIEQILSEELKRFNQIGGYVANLHEQFVGGGGSGFENKQGASDLLNKFEKRQEIGEQEESDDDLNIDLDVTTTDDTTTDDTNTEEGGDDLDLSIDDTGDTEETSTEDISTTNNTEEIDVTDIVSMTKETGEKTEELEGTITKQNTSIESLISKLDELEGKLNGMDKVMSSINNLEDKIEEYRPQTPEEKLELRYLDSGPFNQSPKKYWEEKQGDLKQQKDKHEYVLTSADVENVNDNDVKNSWVYSPEDE